MSKRWKIKAVDIFLNIYTRRNGRLKKADELTAQTEFSNIVIYSTTALGDLLFNTPAIRAVRQRYPKAMITLVAHEKFRELVESGEDWDRVVYWNSKVKNVPQLVKKLHEKGKPELALILHSHEPYDYLSAVMAGAHFVIRDNYSDNIDARDRWLADYTIGFNGHIIQRKLDLVGGLGCEINDISMKLPLPVTVQQHKEGKLIGFQMGASTPERCWPPEYFACVANSLLQSSPTDKIVLIGGPGDRKHAEPFFRHLDGAFQSRVINRIGDTGLPELINIIGSLNLLLTGDTGPLHIAIAAKVPTLSLFVTANPHSTGPYQDKHLHDVIYAVQRKSNQNISHIMQLIEPDEVIATIKHKKI